MKTFRVILKILLILVLLFIFLVIIGLLVENKTQKIVNEEIPEENKDIEYKNYLIGDFNVNVPEWGLLTDDSGDERVLGVTKGICSVVVNQYPALPHDIESWIKKELGKTVKGYKLLSSSKKEEIYYFDYEQLYGEYVLTIKNKMFYCNYVTYVTSVVCVNELMEKEYEEIRESVLESSKCLKEYVVPDLKQEKEKIKQESPKQAELIEEIKESVVKTNVGKEFGIDEEMVVYHINNNEFFKKVLSDFPKANLLIQDIENNRELKLRVIINERGEIISLEDGFYDDAIITLIIPLRDALNIFSNAANINPLNLISFAVNVKTIPESVKNEVIGRVLRGEYN